MFILGIGGIAGSGKTTAADFIEIESLDYDLKPFRLSFADPVKIEAAKESGHPDAMTLKKEDPKRYRELMQSIADAGRPSTWVDAMNERLKELAKEELEQADDGMFNEYIVIIDDVRFPNELQMLQNEWGAETLFIFAADREVPDSEGAWRTHESEAMSQKIEAMLPDYTELFGWSIFNNKDNLEFERKLTERLLYLTGTHASRYGDECLCTQCRAFRADIQSEEMIESFKEAIRDIQAQPGLTEEEKEMIVHQFEQIIEDLENGANPLDYFDDPRWSETDEETDDGDT